MAFGEDFLGDRHAVLMQARDVLRTRVIAVAPNAQVGIEDRAALFVWLPAGTHDQVDRVKRAAESAGRLELLEVAGPAEHAAYYASESVPEGYDVLKCWDAVAPEHGITDRLLVAKFPIVREADFTSVTAEGDSRGWMLVCRLNPEAAKRFDDAAARAFAMSPRGLIAIIKDGHVQSVPQVSSERFGGELEITGGFDETTAKGLAAILRSGRLPFPLKLAAERVVDRSLPK